MIQHAILGIGLNINQISFAFPGAGSWRMITGTPYDLPQVVEGLLERLEARYLALRQGKLDALKMDYLQHLYRYQEEHLFRIGQETVTGCILGIDAIGRLSIQIGGKIRYFDFKEIAFIS